jgi:hypothetical protein
MLYYCRYEFWEGFCLGLFFDFYNGFNIIDCENLQNDMLNHKTKTIY